jgi:hypothetical protein
VATDSAPTAAQVIVDGDQTALGSLLASGDAEIDPDRPIVGGDLRALQALAGFAVDLVGRGRVMPGVRKVGDDRAMAIWSAVVTGAATGWPDKAHTHRCDAGSPSRRPADFRDAKPA